MNCIMLEGIALYIFIGIFALIAIGALIGLISSISSEAKLSEKKEEYESLYLKYLDVKKENFRLRLKCSEERAK